MNHECPKCGGTSGDCYPWGKCPTSPIDVCAACGQSILTTPDDPPATLLCDVCLASLKRRKALRPGTIAANPPQGGLF